MVFPITLQKQPESIKTSKTVQGYNCQVCKRCEITMWRFKSICSRPILCSKEKKHATTTILLCVCRQIHKKWITLNLPHVFHHTTTRQNWYFITASSNLPWAHCPVWWFILPEKKNTALFERGSAPLRWKMCFKEWGLFKQISKQSVCDFFVQNTVELNPESCDRSYGLFKVH